MSEPQVRFCTSADGTRIACAIWGDGPPLLYVPAWGGTIAHFLSPWVRAWTDRMAAGRRFAILDRRGTGASQREVAALSLESQLADVEAVADRAQWDRFDIFAVADGAALALAFAARRPARVGRLALWCPIGAGEQIGGETVLSGTAELMQRNFRLGIRAYADIVMPSGSPEELRRYREDLRKDTSPELWRLHYHVLATLDVGAELPRVQAPALVVHRRGAVAVPLEAGKSVAAMVPEARLMILEGDAVHQALGDQSYLDAVLDFLDEDRGTASVRPSSGLHGGVRAVFFTDLVGHSEMMEGLGDERGREVLREHERITRAMLREHGGKEVKTMGDGFMASFGSVTRSVECAIALQRALDEWNRGAAPPAGSRRSDPPHLHVRVGISAGEPIEDDGDLFGAAVILASRIAGKAEGREILVADTVRGLCAGKGIVFADRGEFAVRGFREPVRIYEVRWKD